MMKPLSTGWLMKSARKPEAQQPRDQGGDAGDERQPGRQRGEPAVPRRDEVRDRGRRQRRGRRHRPDDEHPRAAHGGVQHKRARRGVKADNRRHLGDARVRERLGDEDGPERQAGDQITAQPPPLIALQRREETRPGGPGRDDDQARAMP